jgi:hypothetical protein
LTDVEDIDDEDSKPGSDTDQGDGPSSPDDTTSQQSEDSVHVSPDLTMEERRVLIPPRKAIVRSKSGWEYEDQHPVNLKEKKGDTVFTTTIKTRWSSTMTGQRWMKDNFGRLGPR